MKFTTTLISLAIAFIVVGIIVFNFIQILGLLPVIEPENQVTAPIIAIEQPKKEEPSPIVVEAPEAQKVEFNNNIYVNKEEPKAQSEPQKIYVPVYVPTPAPTPPQASEPLVETTPKSMKSIEIISPINGKGLGRTYTAQPEIVDESNYIELGLIVRGNDGKVLNNVEVQITAVPDESQNLLLGATGNVKKIYDSNGVGIVTHYYSYHYEFKTAEDHTITFTVPSLDLTEEVTLTVTEPE